MIASIRFIEEASRLGVYRGTGLLLGFSAGLIVARYDASDFWFLTPLATGFTGIALGDYWSRNLRRQSGWLLLGSALVMLIGYAARGLLNLTPADIALCGLFGVGLADSLTCKVYIETYGTRGGPQHDEPFDLTRGIK